ncbi:MAG: hypothetical protein ACE5EO_04720 [Candidatus Krumholzibacteriia bacterium]
MFRAGLLLWCIAVLPACGTDPTGPADATRSVVRGITLVEWTANGYGSGTAFAQAVGIGATGANTLAVLVTAYQTHASAETIRVDPQLTPSETSVRDLIGTVQAQGTVANISIKLHVDLDDGAWRGTISPPDAGRWFQSYRAFVLAWATLAEAQRIQTLVVGTELAGTLERESEWRSLIADVRGVFSGELVYAASWDEASRVPFWDALDVMGVNFYAPVTARTETSRFEVLRGWQPWLERIRLLHKLAARDILLTEIGYRSVDGAGMHPYDFERTTAVDLAEQADLYWGALAAVGDKPWVRGVYWWNWPANPSGAGERDYTPQGKPAEKELSDAWRP